MTGIRQWNSSIRGRAILGLGLAVVLACGLPVWSHSALLYLDDNGDGTIYVEAGFSDGSSGAGMAVRLEDEAGQTLWESVLDDFGTAESVTIPEARPYYVVFEGGPGHEVRKEGIYPASADVGEPKETAASSPVVTSATTVGPNEGGEPLTTSPSQPAAPSSTATSAWTPEANLGAGWSMTASTTSDEAPYATVLWVIAGLLAFVALQLALVAFGMAFLAGTGFAGRRSRVVRGRE